MPSLVICFDPKILVNLVSLPEPIPRTLENCLGQPAPQIKDALLAVALKFLHSRKDPIVHRVHNVLLTAEGKSYVLRVKAKFSLSVEPFL